jgi:hypothetical protein
MKIAICAKHRKSRIEIPTDYIKWGFNRIPIRADIWFDIHKNLITEGKKSDYINFLKSFGSNCFIAIKHQALPEAQLFPYRELIDTFGPYFTNTIDWLLAYAITLKPTHILLSGVTISPEEDHAFCRAGIEHYIGIARGKGIEITIPEKSHLLKVPRLYGLEYNTELYSFKQGLSL